MDALLRRRAMIASGGGSPTPPGPVTTIPYIRGGADGSYIDTGITADNTTRVIVWARNWQPYSDGLFGSRTAASTDEFAIGAVSGSSVDKIRFRIGDQESFVDSAMPFLFANYHKYEINGNQFLVDGVLKAQAASVTFSNSQNIHLFGINTGGTHSSMNFPADICACKIYKNDVLVRDYSAVNSPSVGLYDSVSETLFTNTGSGSFTYGEFDRYAYTPLQYISFDRNQYFDTQIYGTYSSKLIVKFSPTSSTPYWHTLLGYRADTNCMDISFGTGTADQDNMRCYWRIGTNTTSLQVFSGTNKNKLTNRVVTVAKNNATLTMYENGTQLGTQTKSGVSSSFSTSYTIYLGGLRYDEFDYKETFFGNVYYMLFDSKSFVPATINNVAGMYDTYNDVFYTSETSSPFIAGPTI